MADAQGSEDEVGHSAHHACPTKVNVCGSDDRRDVGAMPDYAEVERIHEWEGGGQRFTIRPGRQIIFDTADRGLTDLSEQNRTVCDFPERGVQECSVDQPACNAEDCWIM